MDKIDYTSGVTDFANWSARLIEVFLDTANAIVGLAYSGYTVQGMADPDEAAPAGPVADDCYLCTGTGTIFGVAGCENNTILHYTGAAWEKLGRKYTELYGFVEDYVNSVSLDSFMGVVFPQDGSTALTRSGNSSWATHPPFLNDIALVLLADNLTENEVLCTWANPTIPGDAVLDGSAGQVMVRIPKIYYREIFDVNGVLTEVRVSNQQLWGYKLHEKFSYGAGRDYIYIGAYEAGDDGGTKLKSASGVAPLTSVTLATFRSRAAARGTGWHAYDFYTAHLLQLLWYVYFADYDSQTSLPGYTEASSYDAAYKRNTGRSDELTTMNGSIDADLTGTDSDLVAAGITTGEKIANRFLFIENIFGHIWKMLDGVAFDGRVGEPNTAYATPDPSLFSSSDASILADYINLNISLPATGTANYLQNLQGLFLPKTFGGGSTTYVTDYFWSYLDDAARDYLRLVLAGGALNLAGLAGVAARDSNVGLGLASSLCGSRLCAAP